jgi:hypothetical protein
VSDGANDDAASLNGVEDAVVANPRRPQAFEATDEPLAGSLGLQLDQRKGLQDRLADRLRQ